MVSDQLAALDAEITRARSVEASASALIRGITQRIADAVAQAVKNGATEEQLQPVLAEVEALRASSDDLTAAVSENTPATPASGGPAGGGSSHSRR